MSDWIKDMNRCTGPAPRQEPELPPLPDSFRRFQFDKNRYLPESEWRAYLDWVEVFTEAQINAYGRACRQAAERELAELRAKLQQSALEYISLFDQCSASLQERDALRAQLEAAQKDAERLDWLDAQWQDGIHVEVCASNNGRGADSLGRFATVFTRRSGGRASTNVRDAIDAARADKSDPLKGKLGMWPIERLK